MPAEAVKSAMTTAANKYDAGALIVEQDRGERRAVPAPVRSYLCRSRRYVDRRTVGCGCSVHPLETDEMRAIGVPFGAICAVIEVDHQLMLRSR